MKAVRTIFDYNTMCCV